MKEEGTAPEVILITAAQLPKPDLETHLLLASLVEQGIRAIVLPWNANVLLWREVPLVVVRSPWDYFERPDEFLAWAGAVAKETCLVNSYEALEWNIHKKYILDLERRGVPIVPTQVIRAVDIRNTETTIIDLVAMGFEGDTVVKPAFSVGAIGLHRGAADSLELDAYAHELVMSGQDILVQAFVPSVQEKGEVSLVFFNRRFSHSIRKVPREGDFRVQDHHGGSVVEHMATEGEIEVAKKAISAAPGLLAYARVDLVEGQAGEPMVMELELIEPELFFRYSEQGLATFVDHLSQLLRSSSS